MTPKTLHTMAGYLSAVDRTDIALGEMPSDLLAMLDHAITRVVYTRMTGTVPRAHNQPPAYITYLRERNK